MFKTIFKKRKAVAIITAILIMALATTPVLAVEDTGVTVTGTTLSGGSLTFGAFGVITLNGTLQTTTGTWAVANVIDATGTGAGWNLALTLTALKEFDTVGGDYVTVTPKTIATSSVKVTTAPIVTLADATSSAANTITPIGTAVALDTGSPVKLLSAAAAGGMGSYSVSDISTTLSTRADTYAATYKTDATVSMVTGP
jgi:hypothetical protein